MPAGYSERHVSQPDLFVVCRNCGSEVSPYVTECPYCGQRVRKRAPKLDRSGGEPQPKKRRRRRPDAAAPAGRGDRRHRAGHAPLRDVRADPGLRCCRLLVFRADDDASTSAIWRVPVAEESWRWFAAPFLFADQLGYAFVSAGRGRHLRHAARAPLRPAAGGGRLRAVGRRRHGARGRSSRRRRCSRTTRSSSAFGANGAALGLLVRLARGRPPRGPPRRRARQRPARRLRDRDRAGAAVAGRGGGEHRRRRGRRGWPARCSGWRCRCSRARARTDASRPDLP